MPASIDLTAMQFERLLVLGKAPERSAAGRIQWRCRCRCGKEVIVQGNNLMSGNTRSCGCLMEEIRIATGQANYRHGGRGTREYNSWHAMKSRCYRMTHPMYEYYGARGIRVCKRWFHSFEAFLADMGPRPENTTLDRIDNDGNYTPSNCRWATPLEQRANRSDS